LAKKIYQSFKQIWPLDKNKHQTDVNDTHITNIHNITNMINVHNKESKKIYIPWHLDENIPLYQYYMNNNLVGYDYKQLSNLPKFPFLHDIVGKHYSLQKFNPINAIKSYYKSYIKTNRRANAIYNYYYNYNEEDKTTGQKRHWIFNENIPLYQYYAVYNENIPEMTHAIRYNKALLSKLSLFPFAKDIKIRKYSLFKYNPYYFGKKIYHRLSSKLADPKEDSTTTSYTNNQTNYSYSYSYNNTTTTTNTNNTSTI
jgi:hypothetical protein